MFHSERQKEKHSCDNFKSSCRTFSNRKLTTCWLQDTVNVTFPGQKHCEYVTSSPDARVPGGVKVSPIVKGVSYCNFFCFRYFGNIYLVGCAGS